MRPWKFALRVEVGFTFSTLNGGLKKVFDTLVGVTLYNPAGKLSEYTPFESVVVYFLLIEEIYYSTKTFGAGINIFL